MAYSVTNRGGDPAEALEAATRDADLHRDRRERRSRHGQRNQRGVTSDANESFVFGRYESAIVHFHRTLDAALAQ